VDDFYRRAVMLRLRMKAEAESAPEPPAENTADTSKD
jgi:hypothetical protein